VETVPVMDLPRKRGVPASISLSIKCPVASTPWGRNARTTCTGPPLKAARPVHPPRRPASSQDISGYERLGDFQSVVESERLLGADVSLPPYPLPRCCVGDGHAQRAPGVGSEASHATGGHLPPELGPGTGRRRGFSIEYYFVGVKGPQIQTLSIRNPVATPGAVFLNGSSPRVLRLLWRCRSMELIRFWAVRLMKAEMEGLRSVRWSAWSLTICRIWF
jgi:hypothetical protein